MRDDERSLVAAWIDAGSPGGDPATAEPLPPLEDVLGEPTLEVDSGLARRVDRELHRRVHDARADDQ